MRAKTWGYKSIVTYFNVIFHVWLKRMRKDTRYLIRISRNWIEN